MSALVGALRVTLGIDTAAFSSGMAKAETTAKRSVAGIRSAIGGLAAGVGLAALTALTSRALDYASSLGEVAQQLGVGTDALQEYRYAASQAGIEQEQMDKGLALLTRRLGELRAGAKGPREALEQLGFSAAEIARIAEMDAGQAIPVLADAFAKLKSTTTQAAIAADLFGAKLGGKFLTLLAGGGKAINELRQAAHDIGYVLSADEIQQADETADKLAKVKMVLEAKIAGVVAKNAQGIVTLADALAQLSGSVVTFPAPTPAEPFSS